MIDETKGADSKNENVHVALPNTLAWAAHAYERADDEKRALWRIVPDVLNKRQPRLAPEGRSDRESAPDASTIQSTEKKS